MIPASATAIAILAAAVGWWFNPRRRDRRRKAAFRNVMYCTVAGHLKINPGYWTEFVNDHQLDDCFPTGGA